MFTIKGAVRANHESGQHAHGSILFTRTLREFSVDPAATADQHLDADGKSAGPMVLTAATYEALRKKNGTVIAIEPVGGADGAIERIAQLEAENADLRAQLATAKAPKK